MKLVLDMTRGLWLNARCTSVFINKNSVVYPLREFIWCHIGVQWWYCVWAFAHDFCCLTCVSDKQFSWKHSLCIIISQKVSIIADNALSLQNSILAEPRKTFVESGKNGSRRQKNYFCQLEHAARICPYNSTHPEYSCVEVSPIETN